ncbi:hypothetical protein GZ212_11865 [Mangrovimonas sp. CR14]|uniref:hypothetical protein n=1 Tax=Mangrovimonas sp. CR14 TaxID=2706120 RepID=UPI00141F8FC8|nr:hypothetical protein [Mangrovimonas sp. CR14]NIK92851.1 hypothetical protein [Mangrovimonas sp. CR14]
MKQYKTTITTAQPSPSFTIELSSLAKQKGNQILTNQVIKTVIFNKMNKAIPTKKADHYFFAAMAIYYLTTASLGFGYSSKNIISNGGEIPLRAIIHGALGGIWYTLFFLQVLLIVLKKRKLHMKLGNISVPIIILIFITGIYVVLLREPLPFEPTPFAFMGSELALMLMGVIYTVLGYINRYKPHYHKRYYLMSIIILSGAGILRFYNFLEIQMFNSLVVIYFIPFLLIFLFDLIIYRKLFKATWIGFLIYILFQFVLAGVFNNIADFLRLLLKS